MWRVAFAVLLTICITWTHLPTAYVRCQKLSVEIISPGMVNMASLSSMPLTAPAIDIGLKEIRNNYSTVMDVNLIYLYNRSFTTCDEAATGIDILVADYYYKQRKNTNLTVFMFPGCSWETISIAKLTAGWNQLAIIGSFNDISLRDKTAFPNVIQAGPVMMLQIIAASVNFLTKYNWKTVYVVCDKAGKTAAVAASGSVLLAKALKEINGNTVYSKVFDSSKDDMVEEVLCDIEQAARIVTFWGHADNLRKFMIAAHQRNMTKGDYVYISMSPFEYATPLFGNTTWEHNDQYDEISFEAYKSLFVVNPTSSGPEAEQKRKAMQPELVRRSAEHYNYTYQRGELPIPIIYTQYACMYILGKLLEEIATGQLSLNTSDKLTGPLAKWFWDKSFDTPVGQINFDRTGERQIQFEVRQLNITTRLFAPILRQNLSAPGQLIELQKLLWFTGTLPLDVPICGFSGLTGICALKSSDQTKLLLVSILSAAAVLVVFFVAGSLIAKKVYSEMHLRSIPWEILAGQDHPEHEAEDKSPDTTVVYRNISVRDQKYFAAAVSYHDYTTEQALRNSIGRRNCLRFLHALLTMESSNVAQFFGILLTPADMNCVYENCHRGWLRQLLASPQITLDIELKNSLIVDLLQGLRYIHSNSVIGYHGFLNCSTCAITNHFGLKLSLTGLDWLVNHTGLKYDRCADRGFHTPPDYRHGVVFNTNPKPIDIYAAGTLCVEIILERVIHKKDGGCPAVLDNFTEEIRTKYGNLLRNCFDKDPLARPTVKQLLQGFSDGRKKRAVIERLIQRLSKYSVELEYLVGAKTQELQVERSKCDQLLSHLLPASVVESLKMEKTVEPQLFDMVTMMFSDIVGFVQFVATKSPYNVIEFLNNVHGIADSIISDYDVYKVETIGDTYFIVSGLPLPNGAKHVQEICSTAAKFLLVFDLRIRPLHQSMSIRIGIHSGSCVASVIGIRRPRYCLFGDTVNTASRMGSSGEPGNIHVSATTAGFLSNDPGFRCTSRGLIPVKGKGDMETFWLKKLEPILELLF